MSFLTLLNKNVVFDAPDQALDAKAAVLPGRGLGKAQGGRNQPGIPLPSSPGSVFSCLALSRT